MFSANSGGIVATAFEVGDERLHVMGKVVYNHHAPFFSFKDQLGCYGFSMGISRDELKYILPIPSMVAGHENISNTVLCGARGYIS